jgi:hypothetical protein
MFPQRSPTMAFDQSGLRWLGIGDPIAEPEGPAFISHKVARSRLNRLRLVTQDPNRTWGGQFSNCSLEAGSAKFDIWQSMRGGAL